eukprot:scaffold12658_cov104-Cylindrotheca_fusiformis.AAC.1
MEKGIRVARDLRFDANPRYKDLHVIYDFMQIRFLGLIFVESEPTVADSKHVAIKMLPMNKRVITARQQDGALHFAMEKGIRVARDLRFDANPRYKDLHVIYDFMQIRVTRICT